VFVAARYRRGGGGGRLAYARQWPGFDVAHGRGLGL